MRTVPLPVGVEKASGTRDRRISLSTKRHTPSFIKKLSSCVECWVFYLFYSFSVIQKRVRWKIQFTWETVKRTPLLKNHASLSFSLRMLFTCCATTGNNGTRTLLRSYRVQSRVKVTFFNSSDAFALLFIRKRTLSWTQNCLK